MTSVTRIASRATTALVAAAAFALSGCGNDQNIATNREFASSLLNQALGGAGAQTANVTNAQVAQAQQSTDAPILLVALEARKSSTLMLEIERNDSVAVFGNSARQAIFLDNGVLRGSRALGDDLMSASTGGLTAFLRSGAAQGSGTRVFEHINGASETIKRQFSCQFSRDGDIVVETCQQNDGALRIGNSYQLDDTDNVVVSRQWVSPLIGYLRLKRVQ